MTIKIMISREFAVVAIAHALWNDSRINSKNFSKMIRGYLQEYGHSSMDDHLGEYRRWMKQAEEIVNKYYTI